MKKIRTYSNIPRKKAKFQVSTLLHFQDMLVNLKTTLLQECISQHSQGPQSNFEIGGTINDSILVGGGGAQDTFSY